MLSSILSVARATLFLACAVLALPTGAVAQADAGAEAARETARVQAFLDARYKAADIRHSFRTALGDTIDCIDFFAQQGVRALAARGTPITTLPPAAKVSRRPDPSFDGGLDDSGSARSCPNGTVAQVRITPEQIKKAGGLDAYLSRIHKYPFQLDRRPAPRGASKDAPPEPGLPGYAHTNITGTGANYQMTEAALSIWSPSVPVVGDHSLMQTWTLRGGNTSSSATATSKAVACASNCVQSVEAGWTVDSAVNPDRKPRLFVYSTPDGYWTGCYNGSLPVNVSNNGNCPAWVGLPSSYPPGIALPISAAGDPNGLQQIFVWVGRCSVYNECDNVGNNGWEVRVSQDLDAQHYVGVGYFPDSDFPALDFGTGFTAASLFQAGSEVYQQSALSSDSLFTLPMGSGAPATAGLGTAAYVAGLTWTSPGGSGTAFNGGFGGPVSTVPAKYGVWENPNVGGVEIDLGIAYYLGAPAPPVPPPPPPPACTVTGPSPADQFYPNANNTPVQIEQGWQGTVNLILDGPWIAADHGNNAVGLIVDSNLPAGGRASTDPGSADNSGHSYALMQFNASVPYSANPGAYSVTVQAMDEASCVAMTTVVPVQVLACNPHATCGQNSCGAISNGCGGSIACGACASGHICTSGICCPVGSAYNPNYGGCLPTSCPAGTAFCDVTGGCLPPKKCRQSGNCQKVGARTECQ